MLHGEQECTGYAFRHGGRAETGKPHYRINSHVRVLNFDTKLSLRHNGLIKGAGDWPPCQVLTFPPAPGWMHLEARLWWRKQLKQRGIRVSSCLVGSLVGCLLAASPRCGGRCCCRTRALGRAGSVAASLRPSSCGTWGLVTPVTLQHDGSSRTRDQTRVPCIGWWIHNHWTTREIPYKFTFKDSKGARPG